MWRGEAAEGGRRRAEGRRDVLKFWGRGRGVGRMSCEEARREILRGGKKGDIE